MYNFVVKRNLLYMKGKRPEVSANELMNQKEAARALGVSRQTINNLRNSGQIRFRSYGVLKRKLTTGTEVLSFWENYFNGK